MINFDYLKLNIYQIYPKSFYDSNGDGIGDIRGIIAKLDYLKDLGINAIWICPIYKSPQDDNGYDIEDYYDIDPMYGTLDDFKSLVSELHRREMYLIMDFVGNHTSTKSKWFIESRKKEENRYSNFYYWFDSPLPINSIFGGSAFEYDTEKEKYYLHSFAITQADLNWDNEDVRSEMKKVIAYWVSLGVDGFRCDVIDLISKDLKENRIGNGPNLHKYIRELFSSFNVFTVGECGSRDIEDIRAKIAKERCELSTLFQFDHFDVMRITKFKRGNPKLYEYRNVLSKWCSIFQDNDLIYTLFTDNHDQSFMISRLGSFKYYFESATCIASMTYLLRGIPFIYQGIEYGAINSKFNELSDFNDIESINYYNERIKKVSKEEAIEELNFGSRDNPRHPFSWDDSFNGGFSKGKPWLKLSTSYKEINLKNDLSKDKSIYRFYQKILNLRKLDAFTIGEFKDLSIDDTKFIFERFYDNDKYLVICNFEDISALEINYDNYEIVLSNYNRVELPKKLSPYEVLVLKKVK